MVQPEWATKLIAEVMAFEKRSNAPRVKWMRCRYGYSGTTYKSSDWKRSFRKRGIIASKRYRQKPEITIRIQEGSVQRGLLLHELAHWLVRSGHHHDNVFWKKAWKLYFKFLTPEELETYKSSEFKYKSKARGVYDRLTRLAQV